MAKQSLICISNNINKMNLCIVFFCCVLSFGVKRVIALNLPATSTTLHQCFDSFSNELSTCKPYENSCFAVYTINVEGGASTNPHNLVPMFSACNQEQTQEDLDRCHPNKCLLEYNPKTKEYNCCCTGSACNTEIVFPSTTTSAVTVTGVAATVSSSGRTTRYTVYYIPATVFLCILLFGMAIYMLLKRKRQSSEINRLLAEIPEIPDTAVATPPAQLLGILHQGSMSSVRKGIYANRPVAIKILHRQNLKLWKIEKSLFEEHKLKHENISLFIAAEKRICINEYQYWIVTEYCERGSLLAYLREFVTPADILLKMLFGIVKGLVYLHSGDYANGRPTIAHRDIKPGNILVKDDLTCCISDFGLALPLSDNMETRFDLCQTGTKRYMAPEILQGAIAFNKESFLQIDMYAFGLVMWEMFSRTHIMDVEVDIYRPPYFDSVGSHPKVEEMLRCVVKNKTRPFINPEWTKSAMFDELCKTIEMCWDDEADARISIHCVYARMKKLLSEPRDNVYDEHVIRQFKEKVRYDDNTLDPVFSQ